MLLQTLIVGDGCPAEGVSSATAALMGQTPPPHFCSMVVRLIAVQILNPQVDCLCLFLLNNLITLICRICIVWNKFVGEALSYQHRTKPRI